MNTTVSAGLLRRAAGRAGSEGALGRHVRQGEAVRQASAPGPQHPIHHKTEDTSPMTAAATIAPAIDLSRLRPAGPSAAAIGEARDRAAHAQRDTAEAEAAALTTRDNLLLDGSPGAARQAPRPRSIAARDCAERVAAIVRQLAGRLADAERTEALASVREAAETAVRAYAQKDAWWRKAEPQLRAMLAEGFAHNDAAADAIQAWARASRDATTRYPGAAEGATAHPAVVQAADGWEDKIANVLTRIDERAPRPLRRPAAARPHAAGRRHGPRRRSATGDDRGRASRHPG